MAIEYCLCVEDADLGHRPDYSGRSLTGLQASILLQTYPSYPYDQYKVIKLSDILREKSNEEIITFLSQSNGRFKFYTQGYPEPIDVNQFQLIKYNFPDMARPDYYDPWGQRNYYRHYGTTTGNTIDYLSRSAFDDGIEKPKQKEENKKEGLSTSLFQVEVIKLNQNE